MLREASDNYSHYFCYAASQEGMK